MPGEAGANHHSYSLDSSELQVPDIFSLVAQESLTDALNPAFKHLIKVIAMRYPERLSHLYIYVDEIYLLFNSAIEFFCFSRYRASFSEYFYGMKRSPIDGRPWSKKLVILNLLAITLMPYIKEKLKAAYNRLSIDLADGRLDGKDMTCSMKRTFTFLYPYLHSVWSGLVFTYLMRFLFKLSQVHSPILHLCQSKLTLLQDVDLEDDKHSTLSFTPNSSLKEKFVAVSTWLGQNIPQAAFNGFSTSVFFLQFLQWYTAAQQDSVERSSVELSCKIPPPKSVENSYGCLMCPICKKTRTNPTALSVSGFVYCYPCIYNHVRQHSKCPVTSLPASISHLIKIYLPET